MPGTETPLTSEIFEQLQRAMPGDHAGLTELYRDYLADAWDTVRFMRETMGRPTSQKRSGKKHIVSRAAAWYWVLEWWRGMRRILEESTRKPGANEECTLDNIIKAIRAVQTELADTTGRRSNSRGQDSGIAGPSNLLSK